MLSGGTVTHSHQKRNGRRFHYDLALPCLGSCTVPCCAGDFNTAPDRHLGAAWIDRVRPDLMICEATYATTLREPRRARDSAFLSEVR